MKSKMTTQRHLLLFIFYPFFQKNLHSIYQHLWGVGGIALLFILVYIEMKYTNHVHLGFFTLQCILEAFAYQHIYFNGYIAKEFCYKKTQIWAHTEKIQNRGRTSSEEEGRDGGDVSTSQGMPGIAEARKRQGRMLSSTSLKSYERKKTLLFSDVLFMVICYGSL